MTAIHVANLKKQWNDAKSSSSATENTGMRREPFSPAVSGTAAGYSRCRGGRRG